MASEAYIPPYCIQFTFFTSTCAAGGNPGYTCMHICLPSTVCQFWLHTSWCGKVHEVAFLLCAVECKRYAWLRQVIFGEIRASQSATV